jgi:hypothetical protein
MKSNTLWIDWDYLQFHFGWNEVKDKQIIWRGDEESGVLIIAYPNGKVYKMFGYERVDELDGEE